MGIALQHFFLRFFDWFNWQRFWFLMLGVFITGGLILKMRSNYFSEKEFSKHNDLWRKKHNLKRWKETGDV